MQDLQDLITKTNYWVNHKSGKFHSSTLKWRESLGPIYDVDIAPYLSYNLSKNSFDGFRASGYNWVDCYFVEKLIGHADYRVQNRINTAYQEAFNQVTNIRHIRRLLKETLKDPLACSTNKHSEWSKILFRKTLALHSEYDYTFKSLPIQIKMVNTLDEVGLDMNAKKDSLVAKLTPTYITHVNGKGLGIINDNLTLWAGNFENVNLHGSNIQLFKAIWAEVVHYGYDYGVVSSYGMVAKNLTHKYAIHGRTKDGLLKRIANQEKFHEKV